MSIFASMQYIDWRRIDAQDCVLGGAIHKN